MILFAIFCTGVFSSYFGAFVSGGTSALSVGLMIFLGIPPQIAKATYNVGLLGWSISGIRNFLQSGSIPRQYLIGSVLATMVGGYIGGSLMTLTPNATLQRITGGVFLIFLLITYIKNQMHTPRNPIQITTLRKNLTYLGQLFLSVLSGYIPGSAGSLYFILYTEMLHLKILEYKALGRVTALALFVGTIYPIAHAGLIHWQYVIPFFAGMYLGGHFGSKHLIHIGNTLAQYIVYVSIFFLGLYLLFS